jgi:predicted O-methyltransferase YrrM
MNEIVIDTNTNQIGKSSNCRDPYDHLGPVEWVDKQIEYGSTETTISGRGLLPVLSGLSGELICCEVGVCHGFTSEYLLKNVSNIKTYYAVDHYPTFVDWDGTRLTQERQDEIKKRCFDKLQPFYDNVAIIYQDSGSFSRILPDEHLNFVFIDGDHSYAATTNDIICYWPKVKSGGIFAGHDINLKGVHDAVMNFFGEKMNQIKIVENNAWFFVKE